MGSGVRRLVVARFVSEAGALGALFVGVWGKASFELDATPTQMALSVALWGAGAIVAGVVGGVLVDRFDPRRVLIAGEAIVVPSTLALIVPQSIGTFIALMPVVSFAGSLIVTAVISFPPYLTDDPDELRRSNVRLEIASSLSFIAGPALAAVIARTAGLSWVFVFDAATSLVALPLLVPLVVRPVPKGERRGGLAEFRAGLRVAYGSRPLRLVLLTGGAVWITFGLFSSMEPLFFREVLRANPSVMGWVLSLFGVGLLAGAAVAERVPSHFAGARGLVALVGLLGIAEAVYTATPNMAVVLTGNVLTGVALGLIFPTARTLLHRFTPEEMVGRVMGASVIQSRAAQMIPLVFVGGLVAAWGVQRVLVGTGLLLFTASVPAMLEARAVDRLVGASPVRPSGPAPPSPELAAPAESGIL